MRYNFKARPPGTTEADMALVDSALRQAARCHSNLANNLITSLKRIHCESELACKAAHALAASALTAAGYHRIDRGPWRKSRADSSKLTICDCNPIPELNNQRSACQAHKTAIEDLYKSSPVRARSKTAARVYTRCLNRAQYRISEADTAMRKIEDLMNRQFQK